MSEDLDRWLDRPYEIAALAESRAEEFDDALDEWARENAAELALAFRRALENAGKTEPANLSDRYRLRHELAINPIVALRGSHGRTNDLNHLIETRGYPWHALSDPYLDASGEWSPE